MNPITHFANYLTNYSTPARNKRKRSPVNIELKEPPRKKRRYSTITRSLLSKITSSLRDYLIKLPYIEQISTYCNWKQFSKAHLFHYQNQTLTGKDNNGSDDIIHLPTTLKISLMMHSESFPLLFRADQKVENTSPIDQLSLLRLAIKNIKSSIETPEEIDLNALYEYNMFSFWNHLKSILSMNETRNIAEFTYEDRVFPFQLINCVVEKIEIYQQLSKPLFHPEFFIGYVPRHPDEQFMYLLNADFTPLHFAVQFELKQYVREYLNHIDQDLFEDNLTDYAGSLVHLAALVGNPEIFQQLLPFVDANAINDNGMLNTPLIIATYYGHIEIVRLLLNDQDAATDIRCKNENGETALHIACARGHTEIASLLIKHGAKIFAVNLIGVTPFQTAYSSQQLELIQHFTCHSGFVAEYFQNNNLADFLAEIMKHPELYIKHNQNHVSFNPLEIPFLFNHDRLFCRIKDKLTSNEYLYNLRTLKIKYPHFPFDLWMEQEMFIINPEHMQDNDLSTEIPPPPNISIDKLLELYDEINFDDPTQADYLDPTNYSAEANNKSGLNRFILSVKNKSAIIGTPNSNNTEEVDQYYNNLEVLLKHIAYYLENESDKLHRSLMLFELAIAGHRCGGRFLGEATLIYQILSSKQIAYDLSLEKKIKYFLLTKRREIILHMTENEAVHSFIGFMKALNESISIQASQFVTEFDDPLFRGIDKEFAINKFYSFYTSTAIVNAVKEELENLWKSFETRDLLVDWFKDHIPSDWKKVEYQQASDSIRRLRRKRKSFSYIKSFIQNKYGIWIKDKNSFQSSVIEARLSDYLSTEIFEEDKDGNALPSIRREAVWHLLLQIGVLTE